MVKFVKNKNIHNDNNNDDDDTRSKITETIYKLRGDG